MRTLLITGGSSGIGLATVQLFVSKGWTVFELSRSGVSSPSVTHIHCDVTDEESVQNAVSEVMQHTDSIDVVISNAGFGISGPIEFTQIEDAQKQFDVNLFGAVRLTKAVLPILRTQGYGRIIYTSSVAAELSIPYQSFYSASKSALNAIALALANEVRSFGIQVSVLMPGDVATGFTDAREKSIEGMEVYGALQSAVAAMEKDERGGMSPMDMAKCLYRISVCRNPHPLYIGGGIYKVFCCLNRLLPKRLVNWIVGKLYS
jgi:NAD(P)-dependent dehydrogenase (short-subunit alcohol dehydrogenase family)